MIEPNLEANGTLLIITPLSGYGDELLPPYSARGLTQTLEPISGGSFRRTVNGTLVDLTPSWFKKYQSVISCTDQQTPFPDNIWRGAIVLVDCVAELFYRSTGGSPSRDEISGSSYSDGDSDVTFYRPQLTMMVTDFKNSRDEYNAEYAWSISLEEV